jgi:hypothetical protein
LEGDVNCRITWLPTDKADAQYPHSLLGPRNERASGNSAAKRDNNFSPPDLDCHATLPRGSCNGEDDITPGRVALRDFATPYDWFGSQPAVTAAQHWRPVMFS